MSKILITGGTGFVGQALGKKLVELGYQLRIVTRQKNKAKDSLPFLAEFTEWDLMTSPLPREVFQDISCIIHLAGESIDGRWTKAKKKQILDSRINSTQNLLLNKPETVLKIFTVSAQGIYGEQGDQWVDEKAKLANDFLADVCKKWESPFIDMMQSKNHQIAIFRLGLVVSASGGALKKMLPVFKNNLGATLGSGKQWMSWIHLDDVCQIFIEALKNDKFHGIINTVSENPVTNLNWTQILCKQLKVFQLPAVPVFVVKTLFGEMAQILLQSTRVKPQQLMDLQYKYKFNDLGAAMKHEL